MKPMPSKAARSLYLGAQRALILEYAHLGPDGIGMQSLSTPFVIKAFLQDQASLAAEFLKRVGTDAEALLHSLDAPHEAEPQPEPRKLPENPTEEQRKIFALMKKVEDERGDQGRPRPVTQPLKVAMRSASGKAAAMGK